MLATYKLLNIAKDSRKALRKENKKQKIRKKSNNNKKYFFTFTFLYRKIYILLENIFGKLSLYCYICITVISRGRLLEMQ